MSGSLTQCPGTNQETLPPKAQHAENLPRDDAGQALSAACLQNGCSLICGPCADQDQEWYMCGIFLVGAIVPCSSASNPDSGGGRQLMALAL
jgi:hypothetical protein